MGVLEAKKDYYCDEDCERSGCPGHTATLKFYSTSNGYEFNDGQGNRMVMGVNLAEAMLSMFKHYSDTRADTAKSL